MASWMVHLRVAQALGAPFTGTPQEATAYYVGAVGPDCGAYIAENVFDPPTQVTHWAPDGYKRNCDAPAFRAAYLEGKALLPEARAFYTAYYIHLLTDCAAKLYQIKEREHLDKISDIKGVQKEIAWGSQIRSYVFMPYTLVKDHRTGFENGNVDAVMDGDLDGFINAYLKAASKGELAK